MDIIDEVFRSVPNTEELSSSGTQRNVRARKVVHGRLREHSVVLDLGLAQRGRVTGDKDELG